MELIRINPSDSILCGNPMPVMWFVSPWSETIRTSNIYALVSVSAELAPGSDSFIEIYTQKIIPGEDGNIKIDLSSIVKPHLVHLLPNVSASQPVSAGQQIKRFSIATTLIQNGQPVATDSYVTQALKAGAGFMKFNAEYYSLSNPAGFFGQKKFLKPDSFKNTVHPDDIFFLFFLKPDGEATLRAKFSLTYLDGTSQATLTGFIGGAIETLENIEVWCVPAGYKQSGVSASLPEGATPIKYAISIDDGTSDILMEPVEFAIRQSASEDSRQLLYRNSLGGLESLRLYGSADVMSEYKREEIERVPPPAYIVNDAVRAVIGQTNEETPSFKVNTGWLTRTEAERLRDFLLSEEVYAVERSLTPIRLTGNKVTFYSTKEDLVSVAIEYSHAIANKFYSEQYPISGSCPAVKKFSWLQSSLNGITVYWAFPFGYALGEISVTFPGEPVQKFRLEGNAGSVSVNIPRPASASGDVLLSVTCHVVCNENTNPVVTGPETATPPQTYKANMPIEVNNDIINAVIQPVPFILDGSVLDNDVDPESVGLETEVATNQGPSANFKYNVDAQGKITVVLLNTSVSASYPNNPYNVRRKGGSVWTTGYFTVHVKASEQFIYVKRFVRNTRVQNSTTFGDVFIETFKDAACTQALVVTSLTVLYKQIDKTWVSGFGGETIETNKSVTMSNTSSIRIYSGSIAFSNRGGGSSTTFEVLASGDYVKV